MMLTIVPRGARFVLLDDGHKFSEYGTLAEAQRDLEMLKADEVIAGMIDRHVESLASVIAEAFGMTREHARARIREQVR